MPPEDDPYDLVNPDFLMEIESLRLSLAAALERERGLKTILDTHPGKKRSGVCQCRRCLKARAGVAAQFVCSACGYHGPPDMLECCCYDNVCPGGELAGAGCPHGSLSCPICEDEEGDYTGWEVVKRLRSALAASTPPAEGQKGGGDAG